MLKNLRKQVCAANLRLPKLGLVTFTWGNVSGIDRERGLVVIKPSGVPYKQLTPESMVVVDLQGNVVEGTGRPSSDVLTHLRLYEAFPEIGGVVHTHATHSTAFAQAGKPLEAYGTTHADYFHGTVPCTRALSQAEIEGNYEWETGNVIVETFASLCPTAIPGVLVKHHGPFTWGPCPHSAVENAAVLEEIARMALLSKRINPRMGPVTQALLDKHYNRKHGPGAYYGQGTPSAPSTAEDPQD